VKNVNIPEYYIINLQEQTSDRINDSLHTKFLYFILIQEKSARIDKLKDFVGSGLLNCYDYE